MLIFGITLLLKKKTYSGAELWSNFGFLGNQLRLGSPSSCRYSRYVSPVRMDLQEIKNFARTLLDMEYKMLYQWRKTNYERLNEWEDGEESFIRLDSVPDSCGSEN